MASDSVVEGYINFMDMKKIIITVIIILLIAVGVWYVSDQKEKSATELLPDTVTAATTSNEIPVLYRKPPRELTSEQQEYRNRFNWFQLILPGDCVVNESKSPGGIRDITLTFASGSLINMHIVPHGDPEITESRIEADLPSEVMEDVKYLEVDGASARSFLSERPGIGSTREIWFVAKGFLYEIHVPVNDEALLLETLNNWQFL